VHFISLMRFYLQQRANEAELTAASAARSNIEAEAASAAAASVAAAKFSSGQLELDGLLLRALESASTLRWHPAQDRQRILEGIILAMQRVNNDLAQLNAVNGQSLTPHAASSDSAPTHHPHKVISPISEPSAAKMNSASSFASPATVSPAVDSLPSPTLSRPPVPVSVPVLASHATPHLVKPGTGAVLQPATRAQSSISAPPQLSVAHSSPSPAASLSSIEERPVSFSMKPRRPGAPPSRPVPQTPTPNVTAITSGSPQPVTSESESAKSDAKTQNIQLAASSPPPTSSISSPGSAHASLSTPVKIAPGFALPGMALAPVNHSSRVSDVALLSELPEVVSSKDHPPPRSPTISHSDLRSDLDSVAPVDPMNLAAAAASKRFSLRSPSVSGPGGAPQFKPPSSPVMSSGLKCPEGDGEYEGMDTPMAVCTKCFKKRRAHLPS
jgi:hypothetical protein